MKNKLAFVLVALLVGAVTLSGWKCRTEMGTYAKVSPCIALTPSYLYATVTNIGSE